ncbi:MAG: outer membrane beta-barrel protein [Thermoanaerobaculia bacterium]|nr:outer membrane beta-barrel protein [Thermoanaerobaculia bacterium]
MKKFLTAFLMFFALCAFGQDAERQRFFYGYSFGAEMQSLNIGLFSERPNGPYITSDQPGFGASAGVWGQWRLLPVLQVRPALQLHYTRNTIRFWADNGEVERRQYPFTELEIPIHFLLTSALRQMPVQGLILFGGRMSANLAAGRQNVLMKLLPERLGLDIGIGASFRQGDWTIQPELIYSYGMNNVHDFTNSPYDWTVGRIFRDRLSLRISFSR